MDIKLAMVVNLAGTLVLNFINIIFSDATTARIVLCRSLQQGHVNHYLKNTKVGGDFILHRLFIYWKTTRIYLMVVVAVIRPPRNENIVIVTFPAAARILLGTFVALIDQSPVASTALTPTNLPDAIASASVA